MTNHVTSSDAENRRSVDSLHDAPSLIGKSFDSTNSSFLPDVEDKRFSDPPPIKDSSPLKGGDSQIKDGSLPMKGDSLINGDSSPFKDDSAPIKGGYSQIKDNSAPIKGGSPPTSSSPSIQLNSDKQMNVLIAEKITPLNDHKSSTPASASTISPTPLITTPNSAATSTTSPNTASLPPNTPSLPRTLSTGTAGSLPSWGRLVDYFVVVGGGADLRLQQEIHNLDEVSSVEDLVFQPTLLDRFPFEDHHDAPLSQEIPIFCLPQGVKIVEHCEMPRFFTFTLTGADGAKMYGSCIWFYENFDDISQLNKVIDSLYHSDELRTCNDQLSDNSNISGDESALASTLAEDTAPSTTAATPNGTPSSLNELGGVSSSLPVDELNTSIDLITKKSPSVTLSLGKTQASSLNNLHNYTTSNDSTNLELDQLSSRQRKRKIQWKKNLYTSKAFCIISHHPLFSTFKAFLTQLYRIHLTPSLIPIERYVCNFCTEVPLPPEGKTCVQYSIPPEKIYITRPPPNELPLLDVPLENLFMCLSVQSIIHLFNCILSEKQILFHSKHYSILGNIGESFLSLIYPFFWHHVYIPLLPQQCGEFIAAPMPYIMGVHSSYLHTLNITDEVIVVDLDQDKILSKKPTSETNLHPLPERQVNKLRSTLLKLKIQESLRGKTLNRIDLAFSMAPMPDEIDGPDSDYHHLMHSTPEFPDKKIRMAFFRFFVSLFQKYRGYMIRGPNSDRDSIEFSLNVDVDKFFKKDQFVRDAHSQDRPFLRMFLGTQAFQQFLSERFQENSTEVIFFDESIQAKLNRSKLKLYKKDTPFLNDVSYRISRTSVALTPLLDDLPSGKLYHYQTFPRFDRSLMYKPRAIEFLVKPPRHGTRTKSVIATWRTILKNLDILKQQLIRQQLKRRTMSNNFHTAIQDSKNTLRRDHTRSVSLSNIDFAQYEQNLNAASDRNSSGDKSSIWDHQHTVSFVGAPVCLLPNNHKGQLFDRSLTMNGQVQIQNSSPEVCDDDQARKLFSRLRFDIDELCPKCNRVLDNKEIRMGWSNDVQDYRTTCTACGTKFVPRFTLLINANRESDCGLLESNNELIIKHSFEYLSPALLRKEVENLIVNNIAADSNLMHRHSRIFWNLIVHFRDLKILLNFLLPFFDWREVIKQLNFVIENTQAARTK